MSAPLVEPPAVAPTETRQFDSVPTDATQAPPSYYATPPAPQQPQAVLVPQGESLPQGQGTATALTPSGFTTSASGSAAAPPTSAASGIAALGLERREPQPHRSNNSPLDWAAFVLAFVLPPIGFITAIVALVLGSRSRGFGSGIAKAAIAIAVVLSIGLGIGAVILNKFAADAAAHDSVVASSQAWCTKLASTPGALTSDTYGWPAPANTVPDSLPPMQAYVDQWKALLKIAPKGIKTGTEEIEKTAGSILSSVTKTQTLDDASDVSTMQDAVGNSGVPQWVSEYCK
jgi:hypothetical protein